MTTALEGVTATLPFRPLALTRRTVGWRLPFLAAGFIVFGLMPIGAFDFVDLTLLILGLGILVFRGGPLLARLPAMKRRRSVRTDRNGVSVDGHTLAWAELERIAVVPWTGANASYVYCLELRTHDGRALEIGEACDVEPLEWLAEVIEAQRPVRHEPPERVDTESLDALQGLMRGRP